MLFFFRHPTVFVFLNLFVFFLASSHVDDFNTRNIILTAKLINGYRHHKLRKTFSKFYRRHFDLASKYKNKSQRVPSKTEITFKMRKMGHFFKVSA